MKNRFRQTAPADYNTIISRRRLGRKTGRPAPTLGLHRARSPKDGVPAAAAPWSPYPHHKRAFTRHCPPPHTCTWARVQPLVNRRRLLNVRHAKYTRLATKSDPVNVMFGPVTNNGIGILNGPAENVVGKTN